MWLLLRLETFAGGSVPPNVSAAQRDARLAQLTSVFADRLVLFVDAQEVRASTVSYVPPARDQGWGIAVQGDALASFHLTGTMPRDATRLRWLYGLVGDRTRWRSAAEVSTIEWIDGTKLERRDDLSTASHTPPTPDRTRFSTCGRLHPHLRRASSHPVLLWAFFAEPAAEADVVAGSRHSHALDHPAFHLLLPPLAPITIVGRCRVSMRTSRLENLLTARAQAVGCAVFIFGRCISSASRWCARAGLPRDHS